MRSKMAKMFHDDIVYEMKDQLGQISLSFSSGSL